MGMAGDFSMIPPKLLKLAIFASRMRAVAKSGSVVSPRWATNICVRALNYLKECRAGAFMAHP
jgi:hypothetical protein